MPPEHPCVCAAGRGSLGSQHLAAAARRDRFAQPGCKLLFLSNEIFSWLSSCSKMRLGYPCSPLLMSISRATQKHLRNGARTEREDGTLKYPQCHPAGCASILMGPVAEHAL